MSVSSVSESKPTKPSIPWKIKFAVTVISAVTDSAGHSDGTVNRRLLGFLDYKVPPNSTPRKSVSSSNTTVDPSRNLWFRLFSPTVESTSSLPVILFFHGGGFTFLSAASRAYDAVCRRFARKFPAYVVSVNYRLAPEHKYPAQFDDGFDVLKYLDANRSVVLPKNADLTRCLLAGDSAGANLAHHVAVRACREANFSSLKLVGLMSIQPFFGGEERTAAERELTRSLLVSVPRTDFCWKVFLPEGSNRDHAAANVSGPNAEEIGGLDLPETVVVVAGFDPLQDWQRRYYEWMKESGKRVKLIEYPNMIHAFYVFPELPEATDLIMKLKEFVENCSGAGRGKL